MIKNVMSIEYSLKDANTNEDLDTNVNGTPLEFVTNTGNIIPGLEKELLELSKDDTAKITVTPKEAYGEIKPEAIETLPKEQFSGVELKEGMSLYGTGESGETVQVLVKSFDDENVVIDYNHPMAGKTLLFDVKILDVRSATEDEIQTGQVGGAQGCCGSSEHSCESEAKRDTQENSCCGGGHCS